MISSNLPLVSVLLPVYNCEKYVFEAVQSILNQTYSHFELLIIDDCSTDTTLQICKSFNDDKIIIIEKEKNSGYTNSLNYGLSVAKGKYIARMDGDDISLPTRFERQVAFMEVNEDVVVCGTLFSVIGSEIVSQGPERNDEIQMKFISHDCIGHPTVMIRKAVLLDNNIIYDTAKEPAEDFDLWVRLFSYGKLHNLQEALLKYRVHDNQISNIQALRQQKIALDTKLNLFKDLNNDLDNFESNALRKFIANKYEINLSELQVLKQATFKILKNNKIKLVFNHKLLSDYFKHEEKRILSRYFLKNKTYNPKIIFEYYTNKSQLDPKFSRIDEIKLLAKCLIFYNVK